MTLPVGYPDAESGGLLKQARVRKMTGNEEALLVDPRLRGNSGKLVTALLSSCLTALDRLDGRVTEDVARRLYAADRNYLLIELRRLTFGDHMQCSYHCPRCQAVTSMDEDLSTLEVRRVENGTAPRISVALEDGYRDPDGEWHHDLVFVLPSGEDEEAANGRRDGNPAVQRDALLARCLEQVGTMEPRRIQALGVRILASLSMSDRRLIQRALDERAPGPDMTRTVTCASCGEDYRTALDMSRFFPLG